MKILYTAHATSVGGRGGGTAKTSDGALDVKLDHPVEMGGKGDGVNPEQLFAIGYASCFLGAMKFVASKMTPPLKLSAELLHHRACELRRARRWRRLRP